MYTSDPGDKSGNTNTMWSANELVDRRYRLAEQTLKNLSDIHLVALYLAADHISQACRLGDCSASCRLTCQGLPCQNIVS